MSKEQEYQQKLEIIKYQLGIDYLYISILEFEREINYKLNQFEELENIIFDLQNKIEDLEDEIEHIKNYKFDKKWNLLKKINNLINKN